MSTVRQWQQRPAFADRHEAGVLLAVQLRQFAERARHCFTAQLPRQFDLVVHVDRTRAVEPLEKWSRHEIELPETYATGV